MNHTSRFSYEAECGSGVVTEDLIVAFMVRSPSGRISAKNNGSIIGTHLGSVLSPHVFLDLPGLGVVEIANALLVTVEVMKGNDVVTVACCPWVSLPVVIYKSAEVGYDLWIFAHRAYEETILMSVLFKDCTVCRRVVEVVTLGNRQRNEFFSFAMDLAFAFTECRHVRSRISNDGRGAFLVEWRSTHFLHGLVKAYHFIEELE